MFYFKLKWNTIDRKFSLTFIKGLRRLSNLTGIISILYLFSDLLVVKEKILLQ